MIFDNINSELSTLKHYMLDLRHENAEMKRSMSNLSSNHFELTKEVTQLKQLISHLMDKQALFNSSLSTLNKETKGIMRDNIQLKSKHEIFQIRLKNLQGSHERDSLQRISSPRLSSPPQIFVSPNKQEEKDDQMEFQISPRLENINKSTKDRLESLRKDLQDVFKKREENIEETPRAERETIMEEWSNPSELNISQSHSDRSQLTVITCPQGEHSFNAGYNNQGQPSSLMEQVEMLNIPQKDNFLYESVLDVSPKGGNTANTPKGENKKKENSEKKSPFNIDIPQQTRQGNMDIMNGGLNATGMNIFGQVKPKVSTPTQLTPNLRPLIPLSSTASTTIGATQSSLLGSENYSYYPIYPGSEGNYTQTQMQRYDTSLQPGQKVVSEPVSYVYQDKRNPGMMDIKVKKELYLKEENMLVKVLDKLDEQPYKSGLGYPAESNQQLDSDLYRFINKDSMGLHQRHPGAQKTGIQDYNFTQKMMESVELPEHEKLVPHETSTTLSNASRGTKKLKLFRKSLKPKEESPNSKNLNYGDQRLHTE